MCKTQDEKAVKCPVKSFTILTEWEADTKGVN